MGYGLGNYWTVQDGFVYYGHSGGIPGDLTEVFILSYAAVGLI